MMFYKLFGNNIAVSCEYCDNCEKNDNNIQLCKARTQIVDGKCKRFKYNPLLRVPKQSYNLPKYDPKDFEL